METAGGLTREAAFAKVERLGGVTTRDVLTHAVGVPVAKQDRNAEIRAGRALRELGLTTRKVRDGKERVNIYERRE